MIFVIVAAYLEVSISTCCLSLSLQDEKLAQTPDALDIRWETESRHTVMITWYLVPAAAHHTCLCPCPYEEMATFSVDSPALELVSVPGGAHAAAAVGVAAAVAPRKPAAAAAAVGAGGRRTALARGPWDSPRCRYRSQLSRAVVAARVEVVVGVVMRVRGGGSVKRWAYGGWRWRQRPQVQPVSEGWSDSSSYAGVSDAWWQYRGCTLFM